MIDFKKFIKLNKITILIIIMIILLLIVPITYSSFISNKNTNSKIDAAYYVIDVNNYSNNIKLTDLIPSNDKYVYTFSIQNYKDNDISEVDMIYDVLIKTTTNLPLNYELYLNDNLLNVNKEIITDEYGMYFNQLSIEPTEFSHKKKEQNIYKLMVTFPKEYDENVIDYTVEGIIININSRQKLSN